MIDLRSDTVTKPSPAMRRAMAEAEVGDDVFGEDPTVNEVERRTAELVGTEAALFVPSGTMANQISLLLHTRRGDDVLVGEAAHIACDESGAGPAWSGAGFVVVGSGGLFDAGDVSAVLARRGQTSPNVSLVCVENTHNRCGGRIFPRAALDAIVTVATEHGLGLHLDGARLWNAAAATQRSPRELARGFDTVSVCFSKGLGAPLGSALCGRADTIARARRFRKMLGGGMRQAGIVAAAALYALEHNRERLSDDHRAALGFATLVRERAGAFAAVAAVESNIVMIDIELDAVQVVEEARRAGVLVHAVGARRLRAVTHLDVDRTAVELGAQRLCAAIERIATERASTP